MIYWNVQPNTSKGILQVSLVSPVGILLLNLDNDAVTWRTSNGINKNFLHLFLEGKRMIYTFLLIFESYHESLCMPDLFCFTLCLFLP